MNALLAIDTAAPRLQLALLRDDRVDTLIEDMPTGQAERIFPAIAELLARAGVTYADLRRIAVTTGPGSFTGLRIGLSAARGLGLALGIPVVGIGSLQAISLSAPSLIPLAVLLDARRDESYFERFLAPGVPVDGPVLLPTATALGRVPQGTAPLTDPFPDIGALARFARNLDPALFPPEPNYIRDADAKPQDKFRVARLSEATP
ncbi:MAG: tRNA (adenosine(37)-N6)-threonylcarbamoyltransferase complex dimerization subunit type 1 TsaB [Devosia sp.]